MAIPTQEVVTEWTLDPGKFKKEIGEAMKNMRQAEMSTKRLDAIQARLNGQYDKAGKKIKKTSNAMSGLNSTMGSSVTKMAAAATGIIALAGGMGKAVSVALDYEDWIGKDTAALDGLRKATSGMISDLDLARAKTRLTTGDFKLNEKQLQAVAVAAINLTRINKTSFTQSLDQVTKSIKTGSSRAMKELGFNVDLLGLATDKTALALDLITNRFGGVTVEAVNTNERISQLTSTFSNIVGQIGTAILQSDLFIAVMKKMVVAAKFYLNLWKSDTTSEILGQTNEKIKAVRKELSFLATDDARKYRDITGQVSNQIVLTEEQVASRRGALQKKLTTLVSQQEGMRLAVAKASLKEQISLAKNAQVVKTKIPIPPPKTGAKKQDAVGPIMTGVRVELETLGKIMDIYVDRVAKTVQAWKGTGRAINETQIGVDKITTGVKAAMDAAKSLPVSNIPLIRMLDEDQFAKLSRLNSEFAAIKMKMDVMAASGDTATAAYKKLAQQLSVVGASTINAANKVTAFRQSIIDTSEDIGGMGKTAFSSFATALFNVADAAEASGESIQTEILKALGSVLKALAIEAGIKAIFALAEYAMSGFTDVTKLAAAGLYAAVAIAAGAAGAGVSAAAGASSSGSTAKTTSTTSKPTQFAQTVEDKRPVNINVFFNDPMDPSSAFTRSKRITTSINRSQSVSG